MRQRVTLIHIMARARRQPRNRKHFTLRIDPEALEHLERRARETGQTKSALAERYISEGLALDEHPLIAFREEAGGRRAALAGTRLDVWQVIDTFRLSGNSVEEAAAYFEIAPHKVEACVRYYAAHRGEVDAFAEEARAFADREEAAWRAAQALLTS